MSIENDLSETKGLQQDLSKEKSVLVSKCNVFKEDLDKLTKVKEVVCETFSVARRAIEDNATRAENNSAKSLQIFVFEKSLDEEKNNTWHLQRKVTSARQN